MSVSRVMRTKNVTVVRETDSLAEAALTLAQLRHRVSLLPVVDGTGRLVGTLSIDNLIGLLLPKAATRGYELSDLAFVSDSLEDILDRTRGLCPVKVSEAMQTPPVALHPDTALSKALYLIYRGDNDLAVSDPDSGKLVGIVSALDILRAVLETALGEKR
jgi:CBS domain-containing protein